MKLKIIALLCLLITSAGLLHAQEVIKIGIIGLDTSHAPAFIKLLTAMILYRNIRVLRLLLPIPMDRKQSKAATNVSQDIRKRLRSMELK